MAVQDRLIKSKLTGYHSPKEFALDTGMSDSSAGKGLKALHDKGKAERIRHDTGNGGWCYLYAITLPDDQRKSCSIKEINIMDKNKQKIISYMQGREPETINAISKGSHVTYKTAKSLIEQMVKSGELVKSKKARSKDKSMDVYALKEPEKAKFPVNPLSVSFKNIGGMYGKAMER